MNLRVLAFTANPPQGASGRYRVHDMVAPLREHRVDLEVRSFLDDRAFARLYEPGRVAGKALDLARGACRRFADIRRAGGYQLILIHRQIWPLIGFRAEEYLEDRRVPWVLDFDDAVFLENVSRSNRAFVGLKPFSQTGRLAAGARRVAAGNAWLAQWARRQRPGRPADEVAVIPTAVDTERWVPTARPPGPPRVVWIGSPATALYLEPLARAMERLTRRHPELELHVIGAEFSAPGVRVIHHRWQQATEVALVAAADVGIAPLPDDDWSRGKCGLKLLLYMALGLPAVASPVGVHVDIVRHEENGLLARTPDEFEGSLDVLLRAAVKRRRLGAAARRTVEAEYSVRVVAPRLATLLKQAAEA